MRKFEYRTESNKTILVGKTLDAYGADGWELVAIEVCERSDHYDRHEPLRACTSDWKREFVYTFKREVPGA